MKTAFFTWITDNYRNNHIDFDSFYRSFKTFHSDIDLIVFDDRDISAILKQKPWLTNTNCKASFAKLIYNDYDLLVNIDSDFYFFDRCHEILLGDYDIAACANFNIVQNVSLQSQTIDDYNICSVDEIRYVQGGLIASTNKDFWDHYEYLSEKLAHKLPIYENDVLNILWHCENYKTKILDGDYDFRSDKFSCYYNCSSLGRIHNSIVMNDKIYLDNKPLRSYHVAHGWHRRKERVNELFPQPVSDWFYSKIK